MHACLPEIPGASKATCMLSSAACGSLIKTAFQLLRGRASSQRKADSESHQASAGQEEAGGMGDLRSRLSNARTKLLRRGSATSAASTGSSTGASEKISSSTVLQPRKSTSLTKLPQCPVQEEREDSTKGRESLVLGKKVEADRRQGIESSNSRDHQTADGALEDCTLSLPTPERSKRDPPVLNVQEPTPGIPAAPAVPLPAKSGPFESPLEETDAHPPLPTNPSFTRARPTSSVFRRQSLVTNSNARIIKNLLEPAKSFAADPPRAEPQDYFATSPLTFNPGMLQRKIWVKRPNASATLVQVREDDLVDDVRDAIIRKYGNSLGRVYDAPDITLRIYPRDKDSTQLAQNNGERTLRPDEEICRTLDAYFSGGQTVDEALLIEVPQRRTPRPSPRAIQHAPVYYYEDGRAVEPSGEYFPPMPAGNPAPLSAGGSVHGSHHGSAHGSQQLVPSMSVITTGHVPALPSPGGSSRRPHASRPKYARQVTSSPTTLHPVSSSHLPSRKRQDSNCSENKHASAPAPPPLPTPPAPEAPQIKPIPTPPVPRPASPRPPKAKKARPPKAEKLSLHDGTLSPSLPADIVDGSPPPINVLIVEDNAINLRLLEVFMKRLKVRWQTAVNGLEAVQKWRQGGFHLVLMDIQLPIMSGLEATKEIRRLERVNQIGLQTGSSHSTSAPNSDSGEVEDTKDEDRIGTNGELFKSPVIIVALTASSLQSDRREALAAGCNDFLTKPVNLFWLERKVKEWGCMQALIDFKGWIKWKDMLSKETPDGISSKASLNRKKSKPKDRTKVVTSDMQPPQHADQNGVAAQRKESGPKSDESPDLMESSES